MDTRITAKLFHTVVVVGMGLAGAGCGGDDTPSNSGGNTGTTPATTTAAEAAQTDGGAVADAGHATTGTGGGDTMPSWSCCA